MPPPYSLPMRGSAYESWLDPSLPSSSQYGPSRRSTISLLSQGGSYNPHLMSSMSSSVAARSSTWQDKLDNWTRENHKPPPAYAIVSDRRGKRTAWSATVSISPIGSVSAIYWYDGQYVNGAKEDAAEQAWRRINGEAADTNGKPGKVESWGRRD